MKPCDDQINTFPKAETFDPAAALLEALDKLEKVEERCMQLESRLEQSEDFFARELAQFRKRVANIERKPAQPKQLQRADNLREILKANPKGVKSSEVLRLMGISKYTLSKLIKTMEEDVQTKKSSLDRRSTIIILKPELVARNNQLFSDKHQ